MRCQSKINHLQMETESGLTQVARGCSIIPFSFCKALWGNSFRRISHKGICSQYKSLQGQHLTPRLIFRFGRNLMVPKVDFLAKVMTRTNEATSAPCLPLNRDPCLDPIADRTAENPLALQSQSVTKAC